jgi:hypothetical protein
MKSIKVKITRYFYKFDKEIVEGEFIEGQTNPTSRNTYRKADGE